MEIITYKPVKKGTLEAIITISVPKWGDFIIRDLCYFSKGVQQWVSFPSKMYETNGEKKYWPYLAFKDQINERAFKDKVTQAVKDHIARYGEDLYPPSAPTPQTKFVQEDSDVPF